MAPRKIQVLFVQIHPFVGCHRFQSLHIFIDLLVRNLSINLGGRNGGVSHHLAHSLNRYTKRERHMGAEIMPRFMKGKVETILFPQFTGQLYKIFTTV